jgi:cubilin
LVEGTHGAINSPGYPGRYPNGRDCYWQVYAPYGKRIMFQFATMRLETHPNCSYDFVKVYDGITTNSPEIGSYCTTSVPPPLETGGSFALIHFHSDAMANDVGFHITWAARSGIYCIYHIQSIY